MNKRGRPKGDPLELTAQEISVLSRYASGDSTEQIAIDLRVSVDRVYRIARKARKKLKARDEQKETT